MNTAENIFLPIPVTAEDVNQFKAAAKREYRNSKSSAMKSAANAYLVWFHGESENALPQMRSWLDGEIDKANEEIASHNAKIDDRRCKAKEFKNGKNSEEPAEAQKAVLIEDGARSTAEWSALKQVKIETRTGASTYTRIIKFVFGFNKPSDASHVSRYAKALEFIEQHKADLNGDFTVDAIVRFLGKKGGFEAAVEAMRCKETSDSDNFRGASLKKIKQAVDRIDNGNEIVFAPKHQNGGYVFLVGRTTATGVMVCGELAINDNEADGLLLKIDGSVMGDLDPAVDFVSRVVSLGQLVHEGRESHLINTAETGKKFKITRAYSLLRNGPSTLMVVSGRYAEVSLVVHAYPKGDFSIGAVEPGQAAMLDADAAGKLGQYLGDPARCQLITLAATQGDDAAPVSWEIATDMGDASKKDSFEWKAMFGQQHLPMNMRGYDPDCTVTLTHEQLRQLYDNELAKWSKAKADDKEAKKPINVVFDGVTLTVGNPAYGYCTVPLSGKKGASVSLMLRPRDLLDMIKKLIALEVQHCALSGDNNGMLAVSWDDAVGDYLVYIPSVEPRGSLNKTCLGYIKPTK